jgi:hypothetical protein
MPSLPRLTAVLALGLTSLLPPGCASMDKPAWLATKAANDAEANFYSEVERENRVYVIGKSASLESFQRTGELPYSQTFIGAAPDGRTVVIEAEAKEFALQARLRRAWEAKHGVKL